MAIRFRRTSPAASPAHDACGHGHFRYFDFVMAAFVTILLLSNVIGAGKVAMVTLPFGIGNVAVRRRHILFFPVSYVIGDVLTEVYGYRAGASGDLGGVRGDGVHGVHELGRRRAAARAELDQPGRV